MSTAALTAEQNILASGSDALLQRAGDAVAAADRVLQYAKAGVRAKIQEAGSVDATHRAHNIYKQLLAEYQPPPMDEAIADELDDYVERRIAEGGIATDF